MTMPKQKPGRSKQDYGTPIEFLDAVMAKLGISEFDIDLAASADNAVASLFYDKEQNSLVQPWDIGTGWNWLNPEFANIGPWVARALYHARNYGTKTAVLIPASVGANWWRDFVHDKCRVLFLNGRIHFVGCDDPYPKDCALLLYGEAPGYDVWSWTK